MAFALGPRAGQAGYRLAQYETIGSTNTEALSRLRAGEQGPLWIATRAQTDGRGRRGRTWDSPEGNLAASLLLTLDVPLPIAATLGFVAALSLQRAIESCTQGLPVLVKWPNDILVGDKKLAGILLESENLNGRIGLSVGMGVNVVSAPKDMPFPAISLAQLGQEASAEHVFAELSDAWAQFYDVWDKGRGLPTIHEAWMKHAAGLGKEVAVKTGDVILRGIFEALDEQGRMVLRTADGNRTFVTAGDVYFGNAATDGRH